MTPADPPPDPANADSTGADRAGADRASTDRASTDRANADRASTGRASTGPAGGPVADAPFVARPHKARVVCWIAAVAVFAVFAAVATALRGPTEGVGVFHTSDQLAMVGLGVLAALAVLTFTRPRVEADRHGVRIRNVVGSYDLPWEVVRAVRFERGASWATLELADDDVVAMMAIQAADKDKAVAAVRQLRALLAEHGGTAGTTSADGT